MPRILIAFDKFKHAISASEACTISADTLRPLLHTWEFDVCPITDGGEGFSSILTFAAQGHWENLTVTGPIGKSVPAGIGWVRFSAIPIAAREHLHLLDLPDSARIALIEMALSSGIESLLQAERNLWGTHTTGTGELLRHAAQQGADAILLGIGGSATNDLGLGALSVLGIEALDTDHTPLSPPVPALWKNLLSFRGHAPASFPPLRIACDVENPLLGPQGCTAVYGPQKGMKQEDYPHLESLMEQVSALLCAHTHQTADLLQTPDSDAAGGIGFGLQCALPDTRFVPGHALVSAWFDLDARLARADLLLTGEGRFDASSLSGKGPGSLLRNANQLGKSSLLLCGSLAPDLSLPPSIHAYAISPPDLPLTEALARTPDLLASTLRDLVPEAFSDF